MNGFIKAAEKLFQALPPSWRLRGAFMNGFIKAAEKFQRDDRGASMAEYALLLVLIAVICLAAIASFGTAINNFFGSFASTI